MLQLPNYKDDSLEVLIMDLVAKIEQSDYFITVKFLSKGTAFPHSLPDKITYKMRLKALQPFKFIYTSQDWRILLTFIPTNAPVKKSYALVNDFIALCDASK